MPSCQMCLKFVKNVFLTKISKNTSFTKSLKEFMDGVLKYILGNIFTSQIYSLIVIMTEVKHTHI